MSAYMNQAQAINSLHLWPENPLRAAIYGANYLSAPAHFAPVARIPHGH